MQKSYTVHRVSNWTGIVARYKYRLKLFTLNMWPKVLELARHWSVVALTLRATWCWSWDCSDAVPSHKAAA
jgi:hypothetical protein